MNLRSVVLTGALLCTTLLRPAQAQWTLEGSLFQNNSYYGGWVNPFDNTMSRMYQSNMNMITQNAISNSQMFTMQRNQMALSGGMTAGRARRLKAMPKRERLEAERFAKYAGTMYKAPGASQAPAKVAAMFAKNLKTDPKEMTPAFKVLLDVYAQRAKQQGAPSNDVARTMAYCIAANYIYFNGKAGLDEKPIAALRGKIRTALSESKQFRAMSDAEKRQTSESMIILTHLVAFGVDEVSAKAPADKRAQVKAGFRKLAGINLKGLLGVAPERVTFDKSGLIIKAA